MNVCFVLQTAAELAGDIFAVPEECMNQYCGISREYCAICDDVGDWQKHWRILFIFRLVEGIVANDSTEVILGTSIVERYAYGDGHVLRVPHIVG
jgi:hypothetical protein